MVNGEGFGHEPGVLDEVAARFESAATYLDLVAEHQPTAVDAGFSSDVVNAALARIQQAALVLAQTMNDVSSKVHVAEGSYENIENTNEAQIKLNQESPPAYDPGALERDPRHEQS
ncbi:MAG: hypothetical protein GEU97_18405 [Actinophytocola sp.]|nr:hypothetical protein [Actinophytocola sp.]